MDIFYDSDVPTHFFTAINRCRLFHKNLTLLDLLTGQGNKVRSYCWSHDNHVSHYDSTNWPIQGKPTRSDWQTWSKCLMALFGIRAKDSNINHQFQLRAGQVSPIWKWNYFQETIYEIRDGSVHQYLQTSQRRSRHKRYRHIDTTAARPLHSKPCTVEKDGNSLIMTGEI